VRAFTPTGLRPIAARLNSAFGLGGFGARMAERNRGLKAQ
jgi:hypothetical protein